MYTGDDILCAYNNVFLQQRAIQQQCCPDLAIISQKTFWSMYPLVLPPDFPFFFVTYCDVGFLKGDRSTNTSMCTSQDQFQC